LPANTRDDTWYLQLDVIGALETNREAQSPRLFWNNEQKGFYGALPEVVTIYRGCSRERMRGVSWTTDRPWPKDSRAAIGALPFPTP
jgi:hypothetical protein